MKICPYCKEQIPNDSKICPECNEKLDTPKSKKQIIIQILLAAIVLLGFCFVVYDIVTVNIKNNTLEEVQELSSELQPIEYLRMIIKDEKVLQRKLQDSQDKENNDKYFTIFYRNLLKYRNALLNSTSYGSMSIEKKFEVHGIALIKSSNDPNETKMEFDNPKTYAIYCETGESIQGLGINYNYLYTKYRNYLSDPYKEYLYLLHQEDYDLEISHYAEDMLSCYRRWHKKWSEFASKNPSFKLIDLVRESIETYSGY